MFCREDTNATIHEAIQFRRKRRVNGDIAENFLGVYRLFGKTVAPPNWSKLRYLNNSWMNGQEIYGIWFRHSQPLEAES